MSRLTGCGYLSNEGGGSYGLLATKGSDGYNVMRVFMEYMKGDGSVKDIASKTGLDSEIAELYLGEAKEKNLV